MIETKQIEPYIGQLWSSPDHKQFKITDMTVREDDAWVNYTNTTTNEQYACRLEAFRARFSPMVN